MLASMDIAKRYFGEQIFNQIFAYLKKDPVANISKVFNLVKKGAVLPEHRELVENCRRILKTIR